VEETKRQQEANEDFQKEDKQMEEKLRMWRFEADKCAGGEYGHVEGGGGRGGGGAEEGKQNQRRSQRRRQ
jgi:hypothetical protein